MRNGSRRSDEKDFIFQCLTVAEMAYNMVKCVGVADFKTVKTGLTNAFVCKVKACGSVGGLWNYLSSKNMKA